MNELIARLAASTGLNHSDVIGIISTAPSRYKTYYIPKRRGGRRLISQPAQELKALQHTLMDTVLEALPVHQAAMAYRANISIRDNALAHVRSGPILKFDFKEFFPSIRIEDWYNYCFRNNIFSNVEDVYISGRIMFHREEGRAGLRLAIGAPSSPMLSNIIMYDFDEKITTAVARDHVIYTRYADDLTFSARRTGFLTGVERVLKNTIEELRSPKLTINEEKTVLATKKYKRVVTGLVLSNDGNVSIGRERKRLIRAALNHARKGMLTEKELSRLAGLLAFVQSAEPQLYIRFSEHYGEALLAKIKAVNKTPE